MTFSILRRFSSGKFSGQQSDIYRKYAIECIYNDKMNFWFAFINFEKIDCFTKWKKWKVEVLEMKANHQIRVGCFIINKKEDLLNKIYRCSSRHLILQEGVDWPIMAKCWSEDRLDLNFWYWLPLKFRYKTKKAGRYGKGCKNLRRQHSCRIPILKWGNLPHSNVVTITVPHIIKRDKKSKLFVGDAI